MTIVASSIRWPRCSVRVWPVRSACARMRFR